MTRSTALPITLLILVSLSTADNPVSIRQQEDTLATALKTADRSALLKLTDPQAHVSMQCGSAVNIFSADVDRADWIATVTKVTPRAYQAKVDAIQYVRFKGAVPAHQAPDAGTATIEETITLPTPHGLIQKHLLAWDQWKKQDGVWKLASRNYLQGCDAGPHLSFP
jgi:hypothetical protein